MFKSFRQEANDLDLIDAEEFTLLKDNEEIYFRLGKTKTKKYIVIQAQYEYNNNSSDFFQTLLTLNNLQQKSLYFCTVSTIDDCFMFLKILFQDKTIYVKDIIKNNILKLVHVYKGKSVDINLPYKKNENNYFIRKALTQNANNHLNLNKKNELKIEEEKNYNINNNENKQEEEKKDIIKKYNSQNIEKKENEEKNEINEINLKREEKNNINEMDDIKDNIIEENIGNDNNNNINNDINNAKEEINKNKEDDKDINNEKDNNIIKENNDKDNNNEINDENQNINNEEKYNKDNNNEINDENKNINNEEKNIKDKNSKINNENKNIIFEEKNNSNNDINYNDENNNKKKNNEIINENININKEIEDRNDEKEIKDVEEINKKEENKQKENDIINADVKEKKIHENDKNNNNKNIDDNNANVNKLLERIKKLEEENKNLKSENKQLKEQIAQMNYNEEKYKKSEKEKESLKIELQKLKNSLNSGNSDEKKQKNKNTSNFPVRMQTMPFVSKIDLYQPKKDTKEISDKSEKNSNHINIIKNNGNQKIENKNQNKIKIESKPPINLKVHKTVTQSSFIRYSIDNCFAAFTSLNDELLLVYATGFKSLECFDLIKQKYHKTILNAHNGTIITIRHYCPPGINKDLILSGSNDYCAKLWDIESWTCIFNLNKIYEKGNMYSICFLFDEYQKESLLITSSDSDYIKIWGINGNFIKNINKTNNNEVYLVDTYYDNTEYKYYLITGEMKCAKSYDLNTHKIFRVYSDNNSYAEHVSAFIHTQPGKAGVTLLVECEFYGSIRIWNFHNGTMIKKMDICRRIPLVSLCLWNENYLLASCVDNTIKLIDFKNYILIKSFSGHNNEVCTIKKIIHPTYGECLISQGLANEQIKMWING